MQKFLRRFLILIAVSVLTSVAICAASDEPTPQNSGPPQHMHHHPRPQLTEDQKKCLEGKLGKPGEGERPSHEAMDAAFKACGVQKPARPSGAKENSEE